MPIVTLTNSRILELLKEAKQRVVIIMPSIHEEWVASLYSSGIKTGLEIWICIDNQDSAIRNGYGSIKAIEELRVKGATIKQCKDMRLSFLAVDSEGWSLFLESRILSGDPKGMNAIAHSDETINEILKTIFPEKFQLTIPIAFDIEVQDLDVVQLEKVQQSIKTNPPASPDLQRQINTYNTLFQFAELHLEGGNLSQKTLSIPPSALPFKDEQLKNRMRTKFNLFTKEQTEKWTDLAALKSEIERIRELYLMPCSLRKDKSILRKDKKEGLLQNIQALESMVDETFVGLIGKVQQAIDSAGDTLKAELLSFYQVNTPEHILVYPEGERRRIMIEEDIKQILKKVRFPTAYELVNKLKVTKAFYELTWEDLSDEPLLKWFAANGLTKADEVGPLAKTETAFGQKDKQVSLFN